MRMALLKDQYVYIAVITMWLGYLALSIFNPQLDVSRYAISTEQAEMIIVLLSLPVLLIWLVITKAALTLRHYVATIGDSPDGQAFHSIETSLWLLLVLIMAQFSLGTIPSYFVDSKYLNLTVFVHNHLPVLIALASSVFLFRGARKLRGLTGQPTARFGIHAKLIIPYLAFAGLFLGYTYEGLQERIIINGIPNFALPGNWPLLTFTLPYLISWLLSLLAIANIINFMRNVSGALYRGPLSKFTLGLVMVLLNTILLQFLALNVKLAESSSLSFIIALINILIFIYAFGFLTILRGVRLFEKIEMA
jgi:hypothetical protein